MRLRLLLPALLIGLAACSPTADGDPPESAASSPESAASSPGSSDGMAIMLADFMLDPSDISANGPTITIEVANDGPTPHNLSIRGEGDEVLAATADLSTGDAETLTVDLEPGEYTIFCAVAGHESLGMSGTLTVAAP